MRKVIWSCTALGIVAVGGLCWLAQHVMYHPDSSLGRGLSTVSRVTVLANPTTGIAPTLAGKIWHTSTTLNGEDAQEPNLDEIPADPTPTVADVAPLVVIPDEDPGVEPPVPNIPPPHELATFHTPDGKNELTVAPQACPMKMPYCTDNDIHEDELPPPSEEKAEPVVQFPLGFKPKLWNGTLPPPSEEKDEPVSTISDTCKKDCQDACPCQSKTATKAETCCESGCPLMSLLKALTVSQKADNACKKDCPDQGCCEKKECKDSCPCKK
jgi:hypothetical protein